MTRQTKTTIKELTAQYRAVLKHAFFAGIAAVAVSTTGAMAEINVAPGETDITSGVINAINTSINNNAPDKSKFSYTAPDGTTTIKLSDDTQYEAADYKTDSTSKDNTYGITGPTSVNWESNLTAADYKYTPLKADGTAGDPVTGDTAVNHLTTTVETSALHSLYSGASLALSSDSIATETLNTLDYSTTSGGNSYYLYKDGADFKLVTDKANPTTTIVTDPSAIGVSGVLNDLTEAYKGDAEKVANIQKTLNDSYKTNTDSYDYINNTTTGYLAKDKANAEALKINKESLDTANSGFSIAQTNYNGSVGQAIDGHILNEDGAVAKLFNEKEANMSEQLGYNIANNPANPDAEGSLVNALTMNKNAEGETVGTVSSVVGAINANTDAIAQVRSDAKDAWDKGEAWISQELGYDTKTTDAKTELQKAKDGDKQLFAENVDSFLDAVVENRKDINDNADAIVAETTRATAAENALDERVSANTTNIATNAANIATNTTDIATNAANIATNTADIATNAANIATNTADIATNAANIATNTTAIANEIERATAAENALRDDFARSDATTLKSANAYTDSKISDLEDDMSAGIASTAALSSVAVSGVKRGELSLGGGYGYYNNQSAVAFGATMGLTDNWSVNAGAGLDTNGSNVAFRAGTNYKFKLWK